MTEIARLAKVKRQAVTNWRSRPTSVPFPASIVGAGGIDQFDRDEVLDWLERTGRGNNPEARLDAPAVVAPVRLDIEATVVLLALRSSVTQDIGPLTARERVALAEELDPRDSYLLAEVRELASDEDLATYVDGLLEASFGGSDALDRLYTTRAAQGSRGLTTTALDLLQHLAEVARTFLGPDEASIELRADPRDRRLAEGFRSVSSACERSVIRNHVIEGRGVAAAASPLVKVISTVGRSDVEALDVVGEVAVELGADEIAIVIGGASVLCDGLRGDLYDTRKASLAMGAEPYGCALAAAFKLPRGMWREAHRQNLGVWILQGETEATGVLVGDLSAIEIDLQELASDVLGALERTGARSYRYGRAVQYNEVWTRDAVVIPGIGAAPRMSAISRSARVVEASMVTSEDIGGFDMAVVETAGGATPNPRSLGELVDAGAITLLRGARISADDFDPEGSIKVLSADPDEGHARIDPLVAAGRYPHAIRTEPGDVIFSTSPRPHALVDEEGGSRVAYPSRILRVDVVRTRIGPRVLAAAINELATGPEWSAWRVPVVPMSQVHALEDALRGINEHRARLRRHEEAAVSIITHLILGVAEGSVALDSSTTKRKAG